jgi:hypothetical protein
MLSPHLLGTIRQNQSWSLTLTHTRTGCLKDGRILFKRYTDAYVFSSVGSSGSHEHIGNQWSRGPSTSYKLHWGGTLTKHPQGLDLLYILTMAAVS